MPRAARVGSLYPRVHNESSQLLARGRRDTHRISKEVLATVFMAPVAEEMVGIWRTVHAKPQADWETTISTNLRILAAREKSCH